MIRNYRKFIEQRVNKDDIHTYLYPLLYEANLIWFQHSKNYKLQNASYISQELDYINVSEIIKNIPIGKTGTTEDIAYTALFLASKESKYITGQTITVDGGRVIN